MTNLPTRLKNVRIALGFSSTDQIAAELIDKGVKITGRTIYAYESEERPPALNYLQALVDYFEVNPEWLLSNRGEMFYSETTKKSVPANIDVSNMVFIPLLDMTASAGYGSLINDDSVQTKDFISFTRTWLSKLTSTNEKYLLGFTVKGDSMQGDINDGDIIIVNTQYNNLSTDGTFAVNIDDQMYVKTLQRMPGNKVQVISKNTKYAPFSVDLGTEHFKIIGKVIWSGGEKDVC